MTRQMIRAAIAEARYDHDRKALATATAACAASEAEFRAAWAALDKKSRKAYLTAVNALKVFS